MEEKKPDLEIVPKKPTYHKFETAYGKLRNAEIQLYNNNYYYGTNPEFKEEKREPDVMYEPFEYDAGPFKEIQANMKKEYPFTTKKGNDKYTSASSEAQVEAQFPKSEYGIRYKAICDNLADQDKANNIGNDKELKLGYAEEQKKPYKVSDVAWDNRVGRAAENLLLFKGPRLLDSKQGYHVLNDDNLKLWSNKTAEKTVNTPLSKYYKYVNDDDHWVNPKAINLDEPDKKGNK